MIPIYDSYSWTLFNIKYDQSNMSYYWYYNKKNKSSISR